MGGMEAAAETTKLAGDEVVVRRGLWSKVRRLIGRVPFLDSLLAAYYCAVDPRTPAYVKAVLMGALAYFVVPSDLIPDFIAGLGFIDDGAVLSAALAAVRGHITPAHRQCARERLRSLGEDNPAAAT